MTEFDPHSHRMVLQQRWFEDFTLGEALRDPGVALQTSAVFAAFQTASGDTPPRSTTTWNIAAPAAMPDLLAHGFQTLVYTAPGAGLFPLPHRGVVDRLPPGTVEASPQTRSCSKDTIYPALEVTSRS